MIDRESRRDMNGKHNACSNCSFFANPYREKVRFSLKGAQHAEKRFRVYRFLLKHFTDAQRFNINNKISQTVLGERARSSSL